MGKDVNFEAEQRDLHATAAEAEAEKHKAEKVLEDLMRVGDDDDELMEGQIYSMDEHENNFLSSNVVDGSSSIFYSDNNFPPLPDFPCMSSASSSSSLPPPSNPLSTISAMSAVSTAPTTTPSCSSSSSSSAASWAVLKSEAEDYHNRNLTRSGVVINNINIPLIQGSLSSTDSMEVFSDSQNQIPGIGVMEDFGCLDLQIEDDDDIWDPSSIFLNDSNSSQQEEEQNMFAPEGQQQREYVKEESNYDDTSNGFDFLQGNSELSAIFLDWLKQNKDFVSAEDMRSIRLKKSTIEIAMKRLGNGNEGKKQLLKLILQWVESCQLHIAESHLTNQLGW